MGEEKNPPARADMDRFVPSRSIFWESLPTKPSASVGVVDRSTVAPSIGTSVGTRSPWALSTPSTTRTDQLPKMCGSSSITASVVAPHAIGNVAVKPSSFFAEPESYPGAEALALNSPDGRAVTPSSRTVPSAPVAPPTFAAPVGLASTSAPATGSPVSESSTVTWADPVQMGTSAKVTEASAVVRLTSSPAVPTTTRGTAPSVASSGACTKSCDGVPGLISAGVKYAAQPSGSPSVANWTLFSKPSPGSTSTTKMALSPGFTGCVAGWITMPKSPSPVKRTAAVVVSDKPVESVTCRPTS